MALPVTFPGNSIVDKLIHEGKQGRLTREQIPRSRALGRAFDLWKINLDTSALEKPRGRPLTWSG